MSRSPRNLASVADEILENVAAAERIKTAEAAVVKSSTPTHTTEISNLLHKMAEELRVESPDVTWDDVHALLAEVRQ